MNQTEDIRIEKDENENAGSMYYDILANKYRNARRVVLVCLILFLAFMIIFGYRDMKISNFRYLFKYQTINAFTLDDMYIDVVHSAGSGAVFALYKGDLAVLGEDKISLCRLDDELIYKEYTVGAKNTLAVGGKYFAVYQTGGKTIALYDSFSRVYDAALESPVGLVSLGDNGAVAVYTKENGSTVTVYDDGFSEKFQWRSSSRVVLDMAFSSDGERLAVLSMGVKNGAFDSELTVFDLISKKVLFTKTYPKKQAVDVEFFEDKRILVSVGGVLCLYDRDGDEETELFGFSLYSKEQNSLAVISAVGEITVFSSRGKELWCAESVGAVSQMRLENGAVCTVGDAIAAVYYEDGEFSSAAIPAGALDFFVADDGSFILCYATQTVRATP